MSHTTIAIADPSLRDNRGHHFELTKNLTPSTLPPDLRIIWLVNQDFHGLHNALAIYPAFSYSMYDRYFSLYRHLRFFVSIKRKIRNLLIKLRIYSIYRLIFPQKDDTNTNKVTAPEILADELLTAINQAKLDAGDHILFHTSDAPVYWAILLLFMQNKQDRLPVIHLSTPYDPGIMPNKDVRYPVDLAIVLLRAAGLLGKKVFLYAETDMLAGYLCNHWKVNVTPLCLPPPNFNVHPQNEPNQQITIAMLGAAREEKGFLLLPEIAETLWEEFGQSKRIRFVIQCNPQIIGYSPSILDALDRLRSLDPDYVHLIEEQQSSEDYFNCLKSADIVLLIYDRVKYGIRGSGIAIESISAGKPILTTSGTFPESLLEFGAGEAASDIQGYIDALKIIIRDYPSYYHRALKGSSLYRDKYSAEKYLKKVISTPETRRTDLQGRQVLICSAEPPGFSACCRLLEKAYYFRNLGYQVDVLAGIAIIEQLENPDMFIKLRLSEYFETTSLPDTGIKLLPVACADRLEIPFMPLLRVVEKGNTDPVVMNNLLTSYQTIVSDNLHNIRIIKNIFKSTAIFHASLCYSAPSQGAFRTFINKFMKSSRYIAPYTMITAKIGTVEKINKARQHGTVLAPPVSTGKASHSSHGRGFISRPARPASKSHSDFDLTVVVSDEKVQKVDTNILMQRLLSGLDSPRRLRIDVINSNTYNDIDTACLDTNIQELINSTSVLLVENCLGEDSIYRLLSVYHYVPVVMVLLTGKVSKLKQLRKLPFPLFFCPEEAANFLNMHIRTDSGITTASWKTYLRVTEIFDIEKYRHAWEMAFSRSGAISSNATLSTPAKSWSAPSRVIHDRN